MNEKELLIVQEEKMKAKEEILFCECGHWHNTTIKCPECDTLATKTMEELCKD